MQRNIYLEIRFSVWQEEGGDVKDFESMQGSESYLFGPCHQRGNRQSWFKEERVPLFPVVEEHLEATRPGVVCGSAAGREQVFALKSSMPSVYYLQTTVIIIHLT